MTYYETMYIVHPAIESGRLKDLILSVEKNMHNLGGETCAISVWGKKKLAYSINKERYGMYVLFQFKSNGSSNKDFNLKSPAENGLTFKENSIIKSSIFQKNLI